MSDHPQTQEDDAKVAAAPTVAAAAASTNNNDDDNDSLASVTAHMRRRICEAGPFTVEGITDAIHELPPSIAKHEWTRLGDAIKIAEEPTTATIPGGRWISLRCDGSGFSKLTRKLRRQGLMEEKGWSPTFGNIMVEACRALMLGLPMVKCGYTQSDEMTVLIPPAVITTKTRKQNDGTMSTTSIQQPHPYNGRVQKLCSMAASIVTARFNYEFMKLLSQDGQQRGRGNDKDDDDDNKRSSGDSADADNDGDEKDSSNNNGRDPSPLLPLATFDCRVGSYATKEEAVALLLWRAYDCGINGVSDAVHHSGIQGRRATTRQPTGVKLMWLHKHGLLPLHPHQREGTYLVKRRRMIDAVNPMTGETVQCYRPRIEQVAGNVIRLSKQDRLFPEDDVMPAGSASPTSRKGRKRRNRGKR